MSHPDRRAVLRSGLAAALGAVGAATGCTASPKPSAQHVLIGPDSPQVAAAEAARHATSGTVLAGVAPEAGHVDLGGLVAVGAHGHHEPDQLLVLCAENPANSISGSLSEPADTGCASAPAVTVVTSPSRPPAAAGARKTALPAASATTQAPRRTPGCQVPAVPRCRTAINPEPHAGDLLAGVPAGSRPALMINLPAHGANPRRGNRRHHGFLPYLGEQFARQQRTPVP